MPKMHKDFPAQLSLGVALEMRQKLTAIGYLLGSGGEYAGSVRNLLHEGIERFIGNLDERRRSDFESILANIKAREILK
jgi:hypothetical protein